VKRRAYIIGVLAVLLAANAAQTSPALRKAVNSARNFQRYYNDLNRGDNRLNAVERLVFSLVLATSKSPEQTAVEARLPVGRT